jgi:hypothetical protein
MKRLSQFEAKKLPGDYYWIEVKKDNQVAGFQKILKKNYTTAMGDRYTISNTEAIYDLIKNHPSMIQS